MGMLWMLVNFNYLEINVCVVMVDEDLVWYYYWWLIELRYVEFVVVHGDFTMLHV